MLVSKELIKYLDNLCEHDFNPESVIQKIDNEIAQIADKLFLGFIKIELLVPKINNLNSKEKEEYISYEDKNGYEDSPLIKTFVSNNNSKATIFAYPKKGHVWTQDEKDDILFIFEINFVIFSRSRLTLSLLTLQSQDTTTGIMNLLGIRNIADELFKKGDLKNYTVMFLNIKNQRFYNMRFGNKNGDSIIQLYAMMNSTFLTDKGHIGRLGGDNFVVLIKSEFVKDFLNHLSSLEIPVDFNGKMQKIQVQSRAGIAPARENYPITAELTNASIALEQAKKSPTENYIWISEEIINKVYDSKEISNTFETALNNNNISVVFQPVVDLRNGTIVGAEALSRWQNGDKILYPDQYIPILEKDSLIDKHDLFILEEVCKIISNWKASGIKKIPPISVNFSKRDLLFSDIEQNIISIYRKYKIDPSLIEIEFPSLSDTTYKKRVEKFICTLHNEGIKIIFDKYGENTTSFFMINELKVDKLKIDKTLLYSISNKKNKNTKIITKMLFSITKDLKIQTAILGIENQEQVKALADIGCYYGQGCYFSGPVYTIEFETMIMKNTKFTL